MPEQSYHFFYGFPVDLSACSDKTVRPSLPIATLYCIHIHYVLLIRVGMVSLKFYLLIGESLFQFIIHV